MQVGRAGRSGEEGHCHLFLCDLDFQRLRSLGHADGIDACQVAALLQEVFCTDHCAYSKRKGQSSEGKGRFGILEIPELVLKLDMKEEVIETILSYVEVTFLLKRAIFLACMI